MLNNIYIYRSGGMGDVLWLEPVLQQLSTKYNKVYLYTNFVELFENYPIKNVIVKKIPSGTFRIYLKMLNFFSTKKKYHRLDGYCYEAFPKMHILNAYQTYFNLDKTQQYPKMFLSNIEQKKEIVNGNYIILHLEPNATLNFRKIYGVDWKVVIACLNQLQIKTVLVGHHPEAIDGADIFKGSIRDLMQITKKATMFIGVDSGPSHIAASLQIPSLVFFGAVNPKFRHFKPQFKGAFLQQPCEFSGCYHEVISSSGQICKLVGDTGVPKCCVHTTESIITSINNLLKINASNEIIS